MRCDGAPHATSTHSMPRRRLPRDSASVLPCSVVTMRAISSTCASRRSRNANIARARTTGGVSLHPGNARVAACTAASSSAAGRLRRSRDDDAARRVVDVHASPSPATRPSGRR